MEAKDTVTSACRLCSSATDQAEISFKAGLEQGKDLILSNSNMADILHQTKQAGIKEVVEITSPMMDRIFDLTSDIRGDWSDPRSQCRDIWEIINKWQAKLKEWE